MGYLSIRDVVHILAVTGTGGGRFGTTRRGDPPPGGTNPAYCQCAPRRVSGAAPSMIRRMAPEPEWQYKVLMETPSRLCGL